MKFALIVVSALGAAPAQQPPPEPPARILLQQGQAFKCLSPSGCYVANEAGMDATVREIMEHAAEQCRKGRAI